MSKARELLEKLSPQVESNKAYLDISHLDRRAISKLSDDLEKLGLKLGTDFFLKSGKGSSWITYQAYDREALARLNQDRVGEEEEE